VIDPTDPLGHFVPPNYWRLQMNDKQPPQPGDRVRVTYEAIMDHVSPNGCVVLLPGDAKVAQRFSVLPSAAMVETLPPLTLAERMAALADELEEKGCVGYYDATRDAVQRIREELAAAEREQS
jgi:hypothetical protein